MTQKRLKEILSYDEHTGVFTRVHSIGGYLKGSIVGTKHDKGYLRGTVDKKGYLLHRLAWLYKYGYFPKELDHINHDKTDNRISNLRIVDRAENMKNVKLRSNNTSGTVGIRYVKRDNIWMARIQVKGKQIYIGSYKTEIEAIDARRIEAIKYGFHKNHGK